ncbi:MAG: SET domain-containing protein [Gemmatimonadaceae bacterium]
MSNTARGVIVRSARIGKGLFAERVFRPNQTILKITGRMVHHSILWTTGGKLADNCYRFGPETYLDPGDHVSRYVNHSCEPNAAVRKLNNQLFLFAATEVSPGDEITFDYSTILGDDDIWTMRCKCGAQACRGRIKRFGSLPVQVKERYLGAGLVPKFIINTLDSSSASATTRG